MPFKSVSIARRLKQTRSFVSKRWALLIYLVHDGVLMFIDYFFVFPYFTFSWEHPANWTEVARRVRPFAYFAWAGMAWIAFWGIVNRRRLQYSKRKTSPPPLELEPHAASFQLNSADVERWREFKNATVEFDEDHHIAKLTSANPAE